MNKYVIEKGTDTVVEAAVNAILVIDSEASIGQTVFLGNDQVAVAIVYDDGESAGA